MKSMKKIIGLSLVCASLIGPSLTNTGCSSNSSDNTDNSSVDSTASDSTSEGTTSNMDTVIIDQMKFQPTSITVKPGDTIVWVNKDIVTHTATEIPDTSWNSKDITSGSTWKMVAPQQTDSYICIYHPTMRAVINVAK